MVNSRAYTFRPALPKHQASPPARGFAFELLSATLALCVLPSRPITNLSWRLPDPPSFLPSRIRLCEASRFRSSKAGHTRLVALQLVESPAMEDGKVLITGACGFLGNLLATHLAAHHPDKLILLDHASPPPNRVSGAHYVTGDIADEKILGSVITEDVRSIYHLAALVSSGAEANYELGLKVNIDGTRAVIKRCKDLGHCPRLVFTSSVAVFGPLPASAVEGVDGGKNFTDTTTAYPQSSYGSQKLICELLISDATRKGFVDGRCLRLPTIIVRPGRPNSAASSFCSSIIREPLKGKPAVCPVDPSWPLYVQSPRTVVRNLVHAMSIQSLKGNERAITLSGLTTTPKEMVEALGTAGGDTKLVKWELDPAIQKIVYTWPGFVDTPFAKSLGFHVDRSIKDIVTAYIEDNQTQRG